jgi:transcriptional regulator with XRE-family HTH domain
MAARQKTPLGRTFGRVLKAARKDAKLTQEELAAATEYSRMQLAYCETGVSTPSLKALILLEEKLGLPSGELLRRTVEALPKRWR